MRFSLLPTWGERYPFGCWTDLLFLFSLLETPFKLADAECVQRIPYLLVSLLISIFDCVSKWSFDPKLSFFDISAAFHRAGHSLFLDTPFFSYFLPDGTLLVFLWYHWMPLFSFLFFFFLASDPRAPFFYLGSLCLISSRTLPPSPPQPSLMHLFPFWIMLFILSL